MYQVHDGLDAFSPVFSGVRDACQSDGPGALGPSWTRRAWSSILLCCCPVQDGVAGRDPPLDVGEAHTGRVALPDCLMHPPLFGLIWHLRLHHISPSTVSILWCRSSFFSSRSFISFTKAQIANSPLLEPASEGLLHSVILHKDTVTAFRLQEITDRELFRALDSTEEGFKVMCKQTFGVDTRGSTGIKQKLEWVK